MGEKATAQAAKPAARASPGPVGRVSRSADPALASQDALGNAALGRLLRSGRLAPKLSVSQPADPSERHADVVAERLLAGESCGGCDAASPCASCAAGLHRSATGPADAETEADAGRLVSSLGSGIPLGPSLRSSFEAGLGRDLGGVRVHTSREASETAQALHARAFTVGNDVAFASGTWSPDTPDGRRLLAHELAHVAQQGEDAEVRRDADESAPEGGVCEPGEAADVCVEGEATPVEAPPPKKPVSVDEMLRGFGVTVPSKPFGPETAPPPPPEPDVISGAAPLVLSHPLADYEALFAAVMPDDYMALEAAMRRRERIRDTQVYEPPTGRTWVQVPLRDLIDPALVTWVSHDEILDAVFPGMMENPNTAPQDAWAIADNDARRLYLEPRVEYDVDITLEDPDAQVGGDTRLSFSIGFIELPHSWGRIALESLEALPGISLSGASERAGHLAAQAVEAATILGSMDTIVEKVTKTASDIIESPEDYAFNDAKALLDAATAFQDRLAKAISSLDAENGYFGAWLQGAVDRFGSVRQKVNEAQHAAYTYFHEDHVAPSAGETYERVEEESGKVGYVGWKAWEWMGRIATFGGMGRAERNARLYHEGKISYTAWKKNIIWDIGKDAIVAAVTVLTAGEGSGIAVSIFGLEEGTATAAFVVGTEKGMIGGFESAVVSDIYSSLVAAGTSDPGVAAYQRSQIVGPSGWIMSAVEGGATGGVLNVVLSRGTPSGAGAKTPESEPGAAPATAGEEVAPPPEIAPREPVAPVEAEGGAPSSAIVEEPPAGSGVLAPKPDVTITTEPVTPEPPRAQLLLREGSDALGRQLSNQSLDRIEELYGRAVRDQTAAAVTQADIDQIGRSLGGYRNQYVGEVGERLAEDLRSYRGELVTGARGTSTTPGIDLLSVPPTWPPELIVPEVKMGVSRRPYRIGEENLPVAYGDMEVFYEEVYAILRDKSVPRAVRARIKMALDEGRIRWELDAIGNVRAVASGTNALPGDVTVNIPMVVPRR